MEGQRREGEVMEHRHSIIIHRDEAGHAQIWILDYENGKQVGDTHELAPEHPAHDAILSAIDPEYEAPAKPAVIDVDALTLRIVDYFIHDMEDPDEPHALTAIHLEIERALAGIAPPGDDEPHASESVESAAVSNEDITDTQPLSASE